MIIRDYDGTQLKEIRDSSFIAYMCIDKTDNGHKVLANGSGQPTRVMTLIDAAYNGVIPTGKTPSGLQIILANKMNRSLIFNVTLHKTKQEAEEREAIEQELHGIMGAHIRQEYINMRLKDLNWSTFEEHLDNGDDFACYLNAILVNGDNIKRSFVTKFIDHCPELGVFLGVNDV